MYGNGHLNTDRLKLLAAGFAVAGRCNDGRVGTQDWADAVGVSPPFLSASYRSKRSPELLKRAVEVAAQARGVEPDRLARWLCCSAADPGLEALLRLELRKLKCTGEGPHLQSTVPSLEPGWFDEEADAELVIPRLRQCKLCHRRGKTEDTASWEEQLVQTDELPAKIRRAVAIIRAAGRAVTARGIAREAGLEYEDVRSALKRAGLEKPRAGRFRETPYGLIPVAILLRALFGPSDLSAQPLTASERTKELVRLVENLRRIFGRRWTIQLIDLPALGPIIVVFPVELNFSSEDITRTGAPLAAGKVLQGPWGRLVQGPLAQRAIAGELRRAA